MGASGAWSRSAVTWWLDTHASQLQLVFGFGMYQTSGRGKHLMQAHTVTIVKSIQSALVLPGLPITVCVTIFVSMMQHVWCTRASQ